jgi:hypothetical protein
VERSTTAATDKFSFGYAPFIVVVAEGVLQRYGPLRLFKEQRERLGFELRATTLGHVQRVGSTGASDRLLAVSLDGGPSVAGHILIFRSSSPPDGDFEERRPGDRRKARRLPKSGPPPDLVNDIHSISRRRGGRRQRA